MKKAIDIDRTIAEAERRAGVAPGSADLERLMDTSPMVAHGTSLRPLRDLVALRMGAISDKIGSLFVTDITRSTANQRFARATVEACGAKAVNVLAGQKVIVSEYFGDEVKLVAPGDDASILHALARVRRLRVGRERDIVAIEDEDGTLFALGDRMLLERLDAAESVGSKKEGNLLYLPDDMTELQFKGRVVTVGGDCQTKVGETVLVKKDTAVEVRLDGRRLWWIDEGAILGVYG